MWDLVPKLRLNLEYTYLSQWMYTHRSNLAEADSYNNYEHFARNLGHFLEPNSHMVYFEGQYEILPRFFAGTFVLVHPGRPGRYRQLRELVGGDRASTGWTSTDNLYYNFLDIGVSDVPIETNIDWTVYGEYFIPRFGMKFRASYSLEYTKNIDKVEGVITAGTICFPWKRIFRSIDVRACRCSTCSNRCFTYREKRTIIIV